MNLRCIVCIKEAEDEWTNRCSEFKDKIDWINMEIVLEAKLLDRIEEAITIVNGHAVCYRHLREFEEYKIIT